uniref:Uncharacterized protein n=1 Tax=Geospiza parvula TaxID=87175 RepID=A0A8C3MHI9_GEOPR
MVCGGFACSRNALCALNVVYVLVGVLLVAVAGWARGLAGGSSPPLLGGAFAVGVFLLLIAALGLLGALRHHQVLLFFYVLILGLVFLCQLGVSCACLALGRDAQVPVPAGGGAPVPALRPPAAAALGAGAADPGGGRAVLQLHRGFGGLARPALPEPARPPRQPRSLPIAGGGPGGPQLLWGGVPAPMGVQSPPVLTSCPPAAA